MTLTCGVGFKPQHYEDAIESRAEGLWFEVHAENYMVAGGPRLAMLDALRERRPLSIHGTGLSIASQGAPEAEHLRRLQALVRRARPVLVSEHLAWQTWNGVHFHSFLPFPRTEEALRRITENIGRVQDALGRPLLIENPALYADAPGHSLSEVEFLAELAARSGCGLLVDVNNAYVSGANLGYDPGAYLDALPGAAIQEIHLAGHGLDPEADGLLIDSHDRAVSAAVWALFERLIARIGPRPTLIERDDHIPPFAVLMAERARAHALLTGDLGVERRPHALA